MASIVVIPWSEKFFLPRHSVQAPFVFWRLGLLTGGSSKSETPKCPSIFILSCSWPRAWRSTPLRPALQSARRSSAPVPPAADARRRSKRRVGAERPRDGGEEACSLRVEAEHARRRRGASARLVFLFPVCAAGHRSLPNASARHATMTARRGGQVGPSTVVSPPIRTAPRAQQAARTADAWATKPPPPPPNWAAQAPREAGSTRLVLIGTGRGGTWAGGGNVIW